MTDQSAADRLSPKEVLKVSFRGEITENSFASAAAVEAVPDGIRIVMDELKLDLTVRLEKIEDSGGARHDVILGYSGGDQLIVTLDGKTRSYNLLLDAAVHWICIERAGADARQTIRIGYTFSDITGKPEFGAYSIKPTEDCLKIERDRWQTDRRPLDTIP